ncbi:astacin [Oesophagostomum dentatum]|uniref:Metalloendopeptidase n=1 Tax=Oesophagostomum dentatum TaxID=61180 RepID=A0A0B1TAP5_OESDE|nr:astacin [Oesophagostomum dentatum]
MNRTLFIVTFAFFLTLSSGYENRYRRSALPSNSNRKWDKYQDADGKFVIPYVIGDNYTDSDRNLLVEQMGKIEKNTCVKFKPRNNEEDYAVIFNGLGDGCNSAVGRPGGKTTVYLESSPRGSCNSAVGRPGGKTTVYLESSPRGSCFKQRTLMRFLLHVVGIFGEQMREDRNKYIRVHRENIQAGYEYGFARILSSDASTYDLPYDYLSITHYPKDAYAKPGTITIETLDPTYQDLIGQVDEPSVYDYKKVCLMYKCGKCIGVETSSL